MADKFRVGGSNTGDYYQIVNGKRQYFDKHGKPMDESVFLQNNNAQIAKDGSMRKKQNVAKNGYVKQYYPESKSGRYFTVDKNGTKHFYAADDTEINEAWFYKKEKEWVEAVKAKKSGKTSAKAQPQKEEMGLLEGMWESAKGTVKGASKFIKGCVTDANGNLSLTGGARKVWRQTKKLFSNGIGEVANAAWEGIKNAGKKMVKGMFADADGNFTFGSVLKGIGVCAAFGIAIAVAGPAVAAVLGCSAVVGGVIVGTAFAAPMILEGANEFFDGANTIIEAKTKEQALNGLKKQVEGSTDLIASEFMRRGMVKGAKGSIRSYEANLAKTSAKGKSFGSKTEFKVRTRSKALLKTYVDGAKSTAQTVRHPVETAKGLRQAAKNWWDRKVTRSTRKSFSKRIKNASPEELRNIYEEIVQDEVMSPKSKARAMKEVADKADMQADLGVEGMEDFASSVRDQIHTKKYTQLETEIDNIGTRRRFFTRRKAARTEVPEGKVEKINAKIDKAVEDGKITEGQADALRERLNGQTESIESYSRLTEQLKDKKNPIQLDEDFDTDISTIKNPKQRDNLMKKVANSNLSPEAKMAAMQKLLDTCKTEADILEFNFRVRSRKSGLSLKEQRALQRIAYQKLQGMNPKKYGKIDGLAQMVRDDAKAMKKAADNNVDVVENKSGKKHWWSKKRDVSPIEKANAKYAQEYANQHLAEVTEAAQAEKVGQFRTQMEEGKGLKKLDKKIEKAYENGEITEAQRDVLLDELPKAKENAKCKKNAEKLEKKIKKTKDIEATRQEIETAKNNGEITDEQFAELNEKLAQREQKLAPKRHVEVSEESAEDGLEFDGYEEEFVRPERIDPFSGRGFANRAAHDRYVRLVKSAESLDDIVAIRRDLANNQTMSGKKYRDIERKLNEKEQEIRNRGVNEEEVAPEIIEDEGRAALKTRNTDMFKERARVADSVEQLEDLWQDYLKQRLNDEISLTPEEATEIFNAKKAEIVNKTAAPKADEVAPKAEDEAIRTESVPVREVADVVDCPESIAIENMPQSRYDFTSVDKPSEVKPTRFHQENGETLIDEYEFEGKKYTFDETSQRYVSEDGSYFNMSENEYTITKPSKFGSGEELTRVINKKNGNVVYIDGIDFVTRDVNGNIVETVEWNRLDDGRTVTVTRNGNGEIVHSSEIVRTNDSYVNIQKDGSGRVMDYYKNEGNTTVSVTDEYATTHTVTETKIEDITTFKADKDGFKQGETLKVSSENGKTTVKVVDANGKTTQYPTDEYGAFVRNGKEYYADANSYSGFNGVYEAFAEEMSIKGYRSCLDRCIDETSLDALANAVRHANKGAIETRNPWSARNKLLKEIEAKKQQLNTVDMSDVKGAGIHADVTSDIEVEINNLDPKSKTYEKDIERIRQKVNKFAENDEISGDSAKVLNAKLDELKEKSQPTQPTAKPATKPARQYTTDDIRIGKTSGQFGGNTTVFNPDQGMLLDIRPNGRGGFDSSTNVTNWSQYGDYVTFMEKGEVRTAIIQDLSETPLGKNMSGVRGGDNITVAVKDKISIAKCKRIKQVMEDIKTEAELETLPQKVNEILNDNSTTTKQIKVGDTTYDYVVDSDGCLVKIGNDEVPFKKDNIPSFKIEGDEYTEYSFENGEIKIIKKGAGQAVPDTTGAKPAEPKPETAWDTSSPEALDRQLAVRLREMEKQKYDMEAYESLRKEIMELDIEHNVKLDLIDQLDLQEKSHRINPDPSTVEPKQPATVGTKKPAEMSGDELDAAYEHFETQINGSDYYFKDWNDSNGIVETRIIRNGKVVEPNAEGIYDINGRKYTLKDGGLEEVIEKPSPEFKADEVAKNEGEHIGGEVEAPIKKNPKDMTNGELDMEYEHSEFKDYSGDVEVTRKSWFDDDGIVVETRIMHEGKVIEPNEGIYEINGKKYKFEEDGILYEVKEEIIKPVEDAPVEETFTPEELTGVEKIKNDEFNSVKKSIDDVVDNESYTAARERIEKSSILTNEEKAGMMSMLDEAKGKFKPATPSPVTPKTFGQKVGSARRATLGTLGFVAGAGIIASRLGSGDDSDEVTEVTETQKVVDNTVSDKVVTPVAADETEVTEEPETTAPVTEDDINGAETEEALDELSQRINDDTTMSQEDKDKLLALINARKEALKGNDGSEQADDEVKSDDDANAQVKEQTIGNGKYTVIKGNDGHHVVKDQAGKVIPVNDDGTVIIDGNKYQVKPDGNIEEVKEQDKGAVEFKKDTYKDRIQGKKDKDGNKPEITHSQVVEFTKAIQNAKTKEDLDNILSDIFTFKMFKGRKQLRTAIRAKRDAIKHSGDEKLVAKKNTKVEKKSARAIERNVDERKSFLGIRLGKKDKTAIDAEMKRLLEEYDKNHKDIEG